MTPPWKTRLRALGLDAQHTGKAISIILKLQEDERELLVDNDPDVARAAILARLQEDAGSGGQAGGGGGPAGVSVAPVSPVRSRRIVVVGSRVDKRDHIYKQPFAEPVFRQTVDHLHRGTYGLFVGHRQAGKTTMAYEVATVLKQRGCKVAYADLAVLAPSMLTAHGVLLHVLTTLDVTAEAGVPPWQQLQHLAGTCSRLCVIFDEGDRLADLTPQELRQLIGQLRSLRNNTEPTMSCLIVGTPRVVHLLLTSLDQSTTSPFTRDLIASPQRFDTADVTELLQQLSREWCGQLSCISELAQSIHACTNGHRGLVGVCLSAIQDMLYRSEAVTPATWAVRQRFLATELANGSLATYYQAVRDLLQIQDQPAVQQFMHKLLYSAGQCQLGEDAQARLPGGVLVWEALLWAGIIIISAPGASEPSAVCISSPLLLAALLRAAVSEQDYSCVPPLQEADLQGPRRACTWMLRHGVEWMSLACALAEEVQTSDLQPSEYGLRFDLARAVSAILGHDALGCMYRALPEVQVPKEVPSPGSAPRVDYLYKNGRLPQVLIEYMVVPRNQASKARQALEAHYKSSRLYAMKFQTTCFLIIMSVQLAGDRELKQVGRLYCDIRLEAANQWGRHDDLLAAAGLKAPRQAAAFAASLGADVPEADLQTLQIMLDTFPPSATSELSVEGNKVVEPVDILLLPHARLGYIRFHDEAIVHKVTLRGHSSSHGIKFNGKFFAAAPEVTLVQR